MIDDVCSHQFRPRSSTTMASSDNTSGPAPQRKERCTLQCDLSLKEEKSYLRAVLSTTSISSHACSVNKWINYFKPPPNVDHPVPEVPTPVPTASTSLLETRKVSVPSKVVTSLSS
ncbi:hypothetical protein Tco_0219499 [Tanacetum coccineum]